MTCKVVASYVKRREVKALCSPTNVNQTMAYGEVAAKSLAMVRHCYRAAEFYGGTMNTASFMVSTPLARWSEDYTVAHELIIDAACLEEA